MTKEQKTKCHAIIHPAATAAGAVGAGLAQLPCSDNVILVPIQIGMIVALGQVFGLEILESAAQSMLATALTSTVGRGISQALIGWIPGIGNAINASTAAGLTETIGWIIAKTFDEQTQEL
ncbi:MAG: hypothetical protein J6C96_05190 [Oscillospiraceae bacterium]|nr:hypothetical protein [Oscillospiraceae bacterium]